MMQATDTNHAPNGADDTAPDRASLVFSPPASPPPVHALANTEATGGKCRSPVWLHFRKADDYKSSKRTNCMHCNRVIMASGGSTTAMYAHLKKIHSNISMVVKHAGADSLTR